ncbi:MAG: hypothetical protein ACTJGT_00420 [Microbacteriaceae bacterium]
MTDQSFIEYLSSIFREIWDWWRMGWTIFGLLSSALGAVFLAAGLQRSISNQKPWAEKKSTDNLYRPAALFLIAGLATLLSGKFIDWVLYL